MEPFEVPRDTIPNQQIPSVGVKLYEHMNAIAFGMYWPRKDDGEVTILGGPLMSYETTSWGVIAPHCPTEKPRKFNAVRTDEIEIEDSHL